MLNINFNSRNLYLFNHLLQLNPFFTEDFPNLFSLLTVTNYRYLNIYFKHFALKPAHIHIIKPNFIMHSYFS